METFTVVPRAGTYRVIATAPGGKERLVKALPTEKAAVELLRQLQKQAGIAQFPPDDPNSTRRWR